VSALGGKLTLMKTSAGAEAFISGLLRRVLRVRAAMAHRSRDSGFVDYSAVCMRSCLSSFSLVSPGDPLMARVAASFSAIWNGAKADICADLGPMDIVSPMLVLTCRSRA